MERNLEIAHVLWFEGRFYVQLGSWELQQGNDIQVP